jgi:hypothetical protein
LPSGPEFDADEVGGAPVTGEPDAAVTTGDEGPGVSVPRAVSAAGGAAVSAGTDGGVVVAVAAVAVITVCPGAAAFSDLLGGGTRGGVAEAERARSALTRSAIRLFAS